MYAVIRTGGKQYRVSANDLIKVEKLPAKAGEVIDLTEILALGDDKGATVGKPMVAGASVKAEVVDQRKDDKVLIFKRRRRKHHRRTRGHRQPLTVLRITEITAPDGRKMTAAEAKAAKPKAAKKKSKKAAAEAAAESKE
ncbi:MAG: 50S ribosomal protein L21 [Alphaproteobacteria bacterium]|nr:50S ribosomal protein L21 [Alphaproteobacteria bacterium]